MVDGRYGQDADSQGCNYILSRILEISSAPLGHFGFAMGPREGAFLLSKQQPVSI